MSQATNFRWRTVDIVVAALIGVAFSVVFWAWSALWNAVEGAFLFFPPSRAVLYGVWLLPAVLGGLIIRKPGAATFCELVAAALAALYGSVWGATILLQGLLQGLAAEAAFAVFAYRVFRLPVALLAGTLAGVAATVFDAIVWYGDTSWATFRLPYVVIAAVSAAVIAGLGGLALTRALAQTGALDRFPSGRERPTV